jgi:hypothetical protein
VGGGVWHQLTTPTARHAIATTAAQVLDGETLARIYLGEIRFWNDSAIAALNPVLSSGDKLPAELIRLSAYWDSNLEVTQVFGRMMTNFSSAFAAEYANVGRNLTLMPPLADGRLTIGRNHTAQALFVRVSPPSSRRPLAFLPSLSHT